MEKKGSACALEHTRLLVKHGRGSHNLGLHSCLGTAFKDVDKMGEHAGCCVHKYL